MHSQFVAEETLILYSPPLYLLSFREALHINAGDRMQIAC